MSSEIAKYAAPDVMTLGAVFTKSGYFQDAREAAQAVVKILAGQELGVGPVASMTGIYIVKGRVTLSANLLASAVKRSGRYNYRIKTLTDDVCEIAFYDGKEELTPLSVFTMEDAKKAGLVNETYHKFARNMLFARAMSNGVKFHCPDVTGGPAYTPDELGARVDMETGEMLERPADEKTAAPPTTGQRPLGSQPDAAAGETVEEAGDRLFQTPAIEKAAMIGRVQAGFDTLRLPAAEQVAVYSKHTGGAPFMVAEATTLDALTMLLDELHARHRAAESQKKK